MITISTSTELILLPPIFLLSLLLLLLSSSQSPYTQDRSMRIPAFSTDLQFECVDKAGEPAYFDPMCMETVHGLCRVSFYVFIRSLDVCTKTYCEKDRPFKCCVYNGAGVTSSCSLHCCVDTRLSGWWRVSCVCLIYVSRKWFKDTRLTGCQRDNLVSSNADCTRTSPHRLYMHAVCKGTNLLTPCFRLYMNAAC